MSNANLWAGLNNAPTFERGTFFKPGTYDLQIDKIQLKQSQKSGLIFLVETEIVTSNNPDHAVGSSATWIQKMVDKNIALPAVKGFLYALLSLDAHTDASRIATEFDPYLEQAMDRITSEHNPFSGWYIHLEATMKKTQRQTDFTVHNWQPFQYAAMGMAAPDAGAMFRAVLALPAPAPMAPAAPAAPPGWGAPPPPVPGTWGAPPPVYRAPAPPAYAPMGAAPPLAYAPAPPPAPAYAPPAPPPQLDPSGRYYLDTRTNTWQPVTGR